MAIYYADAAGGVFYGYFYQRGLGVWTGKGMDYEYALLGISGENSCKPALEETVRFVKIGLARGVPVAFLNLCSGRAKIGPMALDDGDIAGRRQGTLTESKWGFWTTEKKETDLKVWHDTTSMGADLCILFDRQ